MSTFMGDRLLLCGSCGAITVGEPPPPRVGAPDDPRVGRGNDRVAVVRALLSVLAVAATLPPQGVLVPGRSLGGVRLGDTRAAVIARWGTGYGICRGCPATTLYFNVRPYEPSGTAVTLERGRVVAVVTLWSPPGWRTSRGVLVGDNTARVTTIYGALPRTNCAGYDALTLHVGRAITAIYVRSDIVWGFGLIRPSEPVCR